MPDPNQGECLLQTACDVLRRELLPALPPECRHAALMVAKAMDIAARELDRRRDPAREQEREALNRQLRQRIRDGRADAGENAVRVHAHLLADARARVEISNPRHLEERTTP
jgi:hypothetical protein